MRTNSMTMISPARVSSPRFQGTISTEAGFGNGRIRYTDALLLLGQINQDHFRREPVKCAIEYETRGNDEVLTFDYRNNKQAGASIASYMVKNRISFINNSFSNN